VRKASGELEPFNPEKVRRSLRRAGADEALIEKIVQRVSQQIHDGISTHEIYKRVFRLLREEKSHLVSRYNLKQAIMQLGPTGFPFEQFIAGILRYYGYQTFTNQIVRGKCVEHEIDVVARKDGRKAMIEAKFHNRPGRKSEIKDVLYTYARFLDVQEKFDQVWLVTNTKVTSEAIAYASCVGMQLVSWDYPEDSSLSHLINKSDLRPITVFEDMPKSTRRELFNRGIIFSRDLKESEKS